MKKLSILVPVDFSELSQKALKAANEMAKLFKGNITPMHAYVPITELEGPYAIGLGPNLNEEYDEIEHTLQQKLDEQAQKHVSAAFLKEGEIHVGSPAQTIVEVSKEFDMVCMSTHGRTGFTRLLLGSVADKVLRLADVPVLIVEKESQLVPMDRILVTTDLSENSEAAFPFANELAKKTGAQLDLLHIVSTEHLDHKETLETVISLRKERLKVIAKEFFHEIPNNRIVTKVSVSNNAPHEAILEASSEQLYNLIVMATIGNTGLDYLMLGSTTGNVIRHVESAVLAVKPPEYDQ